MTLLFAVACSVSLPWRNEPTGGEINIAFLVQNNLLFLSHARIDGRDGRFLFGSAEPRTVLDPKFAQDGSHSLQLNERQSIQFTPVVIDLHGVSDGIIGADVWSGHAVTIDYRAGLVTWQREGIHPELMTVFSYADVPMINVMVDGQKLSAIVDTTSPDTLVLPGTAARRRNAHVQIAGTDFGNVDVRVGGVTAARLGNRLLSRFLLSIDYGRRQVGLWRDPRIPL